MAKRSREINVFSMSFLDVLSCALGAAVLLLVLVQTQSDEQSKQLADAKEDAKAQRSAVADLSGQLTKCKKALEKCKRKADVCQGALDDCKKKAKVCKTALDNCTRGGGQGDAMGMCEVTVSQVEITVWDHQTEDGDKIEISLGNRVLQASLTLRKPPNQFRDTIPLIMGANYLNIKALHEGTAGNNTAKIQVKPCKNGQPEDWSWSLTKGQSKHISIVRK